MQVRRAAGATRAPARRRPVARVLGALALIALLVLARFPYERLLPPVLAAASAATGAEIRVGSLGLGLGRDGPRIEARDLELQWPSASTLRLAELDVRPAWSLAWLRGQPRWHVAAEGDVGRWTGVLARDELAGEWSEVDVDALPWLLFGAGSPLHGRLSGALDLARSDGVWLGVAKVLGSGGSVDFPNLPVAIPYEALRADLVFAADAWTLSGLRLEGPLVTANVAGTARVDGNAFASWPLDLDVQIESVDKALRGYLPPLGIPVDPDGHARLRVTGSLGAPYLTGSGPGDGAPP